MVGVFVQSPLDHSVQGQIDLAVDPKLKLIRRKIRDGLTEDQASALALSYVLRIHSGSARQSSSSPYYPCPCLLLLCILRCRLTDPQPDQEDLRTTIYRCASSLVCCFTLVMLLERLYHFFAALESWKMNLIAKPQKNKQKLPQLHVNATLSYFWVEDFKPS